MISPDMTIDKASAFKDLQIVSFYVLRSFPFAEFQGETKNDEFVIGRFVDGKVVLGKSDRLYKAQTNADVVVIDVTKKKSLKQIFLDLGWQFLNNCDILFV